MSSSEVDRQRLATPRLRARGVQWGQLCLNQLNRWPRGPVRSYLQQGPWWRGRTPSKTSPANRRGRSALASQSQLAWVPHPSGLGRLRLQPIERFPDVSEAAAPPVRGGAHLSLSGGNPSPRPSPLGTAGRGGAGRRAYRPFRSKGSDQTGRLRVF